LIQLRHPATGQFDRRQGPEPGRRRKRHISPVHSGLGRPSAPI